MRIFISISLFDLIEINYYYMRSFSSGQWHNWPQHQQKQAQQRIPGALARSLASLALIVMISNNMLRSFDIFLILSLSLSLL